MTAKKKVSSAKTSRPASADEAKTYQPSQSQPITSHKLVHSLDP